MPTSVPPSPSPAPEPLLAAANVEARQRYFDQLAALPPLDILSRWHRAAASGLGDDVTLALLREAFIKSLSGSPQDDPALLDAFLQALNDPAFPLADRAMFAKALAESATLPGCRALLDFATNSPTNQPDLMDAVMEAIGTLGAERRADGTFPSDLSAPVEAVFKNASSQPGDQELALATARALGQLGTQAGTQALLSAFKAQAEVAGPDSAPALKVGLQRAIERISNPEAIPPLAQVITMSPAYGPALSNPLLSISGSALVHIGNAEAVTPLFDWLQRAPSEAQPLAATWFQNIRNPETDLLVKERLQTATFNSSAVRTTLQERALANTPQEIPLK